MQPRNPNTTCGLSFASRPSMPILPSAFWSAMSRTLHVFSSTTSASDSRGYERMRDLFGVALVHLATISLDEEFRHGWTETIHSSARCATSTLSAFHRVDLG